MIERTKQSDKLSSQMKKRAEEVIIPKPIYDGDFGTIISTGSTLLDLSISGGRVRGGGIPGGILVEIFGPSGSGKTVLLSEIAGAIQRQRGEVMFFDPEARLNPIFASLFGLNIDKKNYSNPDTVTELFKTVRAWDPEDKKVIHGIFADSLAALSTTLEMENEAGDKYGMRRAKEFSEELRKTCRILKDKNYLMVCSNQIRDNPDAGPYGQKYVTPGGKAMEFYSSLRLKFNKPENIKEERLIAAKKVTRIIGVEVQVEVSKSSIWKPKHVAPVTILFDYGIDDIRQNLQFIKDYTRMTVYGLGTSRGLGKSMDEAISVVEKEHLESALKEEVIDLWEEIEGKFKQERSPKR